MIKVNDMIRGKSKKNRDVESSILKNNLESYTTKYWRAASSRYLLDWLSTFEDKLERYSKREEINDSNNKIHEGDLKLTLTFNQKIWSHLSINPDSNIVFHLCKLAEDVYDNPELSVQQKVEVIDNIAETLDSVLTKSDLVLSQEGELLDLFMDDGTTSKVIDYCATMVHPKIYETVLRHSTTDRYLDDATAGRKKMQAMQEQKNQEHENTGKSNMRLWINWSKDSLNIIFRFISLFLLFWIEKYMLDMKDGNYFQMYLCSLILLIYLMFVIKEELSQWNAPDKIRGKLPFKDKIRVYLFDEWNYVDFFYSVLLVFYIQDGPG